MTATPRAAPAASGDGEPITLTADTRVRLHTLATRPDGDSWIIGRVATGDFITAPQIANRAVALLAAGRSVADVQAALEVEHGKGVDVADFVATLMDVGFVAAVDGRQLRQPAPPRPTLPRLKPSQVRWTLHPATAAGLGILLLAAVTAILADPTLVPGHHDLIWSTRGSAVIVGNAAIAWTLIAIHELAHLTTARAAGAPARIGLGTRLQFLAVQTDVSGVWAAPGRTRLTVYLAGMAVNLAIAAIIVLVVASSEPSGAARKLLAAIMLISLLLLPAQLMIFMRTDVYFVVQDLTGCANLYADGAAYLRYQARRCWQGIRRTGDAPGDPTVALAARERRAVRIYTVVLAIGTTICLTAAATIAMPAGITLLDRAVHTALARHATTTARVDALAVLAVTGGFQLLWLRMWWRHHGPRVARYVSRSVHSREEGGEGGGEDRDRED